MHAIHVKLTLIAATALAAWHASAGVPLTWTVEATRATPAAFDAYQGETLALEAVITASGKPLEITGEPALYWQTNGMGSSYWAAPASVASNRLSAVWTPDMDVGARAYNCFIGITGEIYRAAFQLRMRPSPGATPNTLPLPTPVIDFAMVTVLNPPWAEGGGIDTNAVERIANLAVETNETVTARANAAIDAAGCVRTNEDGKVIGDRIDVGGFTLQPTGIWSDDYRVYLTQGELVLNNDGAACIQLDGATLATGDDDYSGWRRFGHLSSRTGEFLPFAYVREVGVKRWEPDRNYDYGDLVCHAGTVYRCVVDELPSPSEFDATHWEIPFALVSQIEAATNGLIAASNPTFSNAVLAVVVDTNLVANIGELREFFDGLPVGTVGTSLGGIILALLSAVAWLKRNKVGQSEVDEAKAELNERIDLIEATSHPNMGIVGAPKFTEGVVSGFSANDYLVFPTEVSVGQNAVDFYMAFTTGANVTAQQNILDSWCGLAFAIQNGGTITAASQDGMTFVTASSTGTISANTAYRLKLEFRHIGGSYTIATYLATGSGEYAQIGGVVTLTAPVHPTATYWGGANPTSGVSHIFGGSINLSECRMDWNGRTVWRGYTEVPTYSKGVRDDGSPVDQELHDFFTAANGALEATIAAKLPYPLNTAGTILDRNINVVTSGAFVIPEGFKDLLIRYTGVPTSLTFSGTDASIADYGDDLPTETGDYLITVTRTNAAECYIRIIKLEARA